MSTGNENNAVKILIVDVDSSDVRYLLSTFRWLPSTLICLFYYKTISYRPILISSSWLLHSSGLSCPHANFVEDSFLLAVKKFLDEGGLFIINLVSRSSAVREMVVSRLKAVRWESRHTFFFFLHNRIQQISEYSYLAKITTFFVGLWAPIFTTSRRRFKWSFICNPKWKMPG